MELLQVLQEASGRVPVAQERSLAMLAPPPHAERHLSAFTGVLEDEQERAAAVHV